MMLGLATRVAMNNTYIEIAQRRVKVLLLPSIWRVGIPVLARVFI